MIHEVVLMAKTMWCFIIGHDYKARLRLRDDERMEGYYQCSCCGKEI